MGLSGAGLLARVSSVEPALRSWTGAPWLWGYASSCVWLGLTCRRGSAASVRACPGPMCVEHNERSE